MSLSILDVMALLSLYIAKQQSRIAPLRQHFVPCALTLKMSSGNESILRKSAFWVLYFPQVPLHKHAYPWETFDGAADSSAVTSHYRSVNQGLGKLWHAWHVLLLVTVFFELQACEQVECRKRKWCIMLLHQQEVWHTPTCAACAQTCLGNFSCVFALARRVAQAAQILTVDTEHVLVAHDQIWSCAVCPPVVLINSEPFLGMEKGAIINWE